MPFDVASFKTTTCKLPIAFFNERIVLEYQPYIVGNPEMRDERARRYAEARKAIIAKVGPDDVPAADVDDEVTREDDRLTWAEVDRPLVEFACSMMASWDIEVDGEPLPATPESWEHWKFPPSLARAIINEIEGDTASLGERSRARKA